MNNERTILSVGRVTCEETRITRREQSLSCSRLQALPLKGPTVSDLGFVWHIVPVATARLHFGGEKGAAGIT